MRVLMTCYPANVHLYPIAPIAWALQSAGHEVRIATHLHPGFTDPLTRTGLIPVSLGNPDDPEPIFREDAGMSAMPEEVDAYAKIMELDSDEREHWICFYQYLIHPPKPSGHTGRGCRTEHQGQLVQPNPLEWGTPAGESPVGEG
jgi:hypothetical protein